MQRLHDLAVERGIRGKFLLIAGGTQVTDALATACGLDAGFGRGTKGQQVATFIVKKLLAAENAAGAAGMVE
jgi:D-ornithine 4,5-aminomutase subunit beta